MPAPQKSLLAELAKANFISKGIQLPMDWAQPGDQYPQAFQPAEKMVAPNSPTNLFRESTLNKYHVDTSKTIGDQFDKYIDGICGAIGDGIDKWMKMTMIAGALINGPVGMVLPGCVNGPPLMPLIFATAPKGTPQEIKYSQAISNAFGTMWLPWHLGLTGMLSYPAFAAFPGPMAPPMPNIPVPLITFASPGESGLSPASLKNLMTANLADPTANHAVDLFDSIAMAFAAVFPIFKASTMVMNVLGMGPIPTFAPPFVPVGPVLGGTVIPTPGVLV
jgi:hypothetical protein